MLIVAGVLLMIYPPLLSIIVALFLIFTGAAMISITRYNRRYQRHFEHPMVERFFRY